MKVYKLDQQEIQELFILKANLNTKDETRNYLDSIRQKFIELCQTNEDWVIEYLTPDRESISGDIFKEVYLPGGHLMFYIWNNRLNIYSDLKQQLLHIIGETHRFVNWED